MTTTATERTTAAPSRWTLDPDGCRVDLTSSDVGPDPPSRELRPVRRLVRGRQDGAAIELTVDADSIDTGNAKRDADLRSSDFFDVDGHA